MIQQPELGKKIAESRKEQGLTQEELVERCNISVRTLQRIECGEAKPRIYTLKEIFNALGLDFHKVMTPYSDAGTVEQKKWLEQCYISFLDLFNLKTNTMKKVSILSILIASVIVGVLTLNHSLNAQQNEPSDLKPTKKTKIRSLPFYSFECDGCFTKNGLMIGRDVSFRLNGVDMKNIRLLVIDSETREFNTSFTDGILLEQKIIMNYPKELFLENDLVYSADEIVKSEIEIQLKGNAKINYINNNDNPNDDELFEAKEIIIKIE